jgi:hypothetical protein
VGADARRREVDRQRLGVAGPPDDHALGDYCKLRGKSVKTLLHERTRRPT